MKDKVLDKFLHECKVIKKRFQLPVHAHAVKKEISPYADPNNWRPVGVVELFQANSDSTNVFLGTFLESVFRDARRLERIREDGNACKGLPKSQQILPAFGREVGSRRDTESEVLALTQRFDELMGEYNDQEALGVL